MVDGGKVILFLIGLLIVVFAGIEYFYGKGKCCNCCKTVATSQGVVEYCNTNDGCCRCSFFKEHFDIDIYFWEK